MSWPRGTAGEGAGSFTYPSGERPGSFALPRAEAGGSERTGELADVESGVRGIVTASRIQDASVGLARYKAGRGLDARDREALESFRGALGKLQEDVDAAVARISEPVDGFAVAIAGTVRGQADAASRAEYVERLFGVTDAVLAGQEVETDEIAQVQRFLVAAGERNYERLVRSRG